LERLLSNLLALTDLTAGRLQASIEPVLLARLAMRLRAEMDGRTESHAFVVDAAPDLPPADADPALMEEVQRNLYENAVKYSPNGGPSAPRWGRTRE
jgi:K+-sensing histidine kinase KdpD